MGKPLFRWTIGTCLPQGLEILGESIRVTTNTLGVDNFDWVVSHNSLGQPELDTIKGHIGSLPIRLFAQTWEQHIPIPDSPQSPRRADGTYEWNGNNCGGTLWKVCPPRMRMDSHEIVMDNDIVLLKKFPQIDHFLKMKNMALILEEPIRFYGRYDSLFPANQPFLNSGFMGFPPGYDFGAEIYRVWEENGKFTGLSQADEQGLLTHTLSRIPSVRVKKEQMKELLARDFRQSITGDEEGLHFTQANRIGSHLWWNKYKERKSNG